MSQSSFIAAMLILGFVLWLAAKNRLSAYTAVLWGPTNAPLPSYQPSGTGGTVADTVTNLGGISGAMTSGGNAGLAYSLGALGF